MRSNKRDKLGFSDRNSWEKRRKNNCLVTSSVDLIPPDGPSRTLRVCSSWAGSIRGILRILSVHNHEILYLKIELQILTWKWRKSKKTNDSIYIAATSVGRNIERFFFLFYITESLPRICDHDFIIWAHDAWSVLFCQHVWLWSFHLV